MMDLLSKTFLTAFAVFGLLSVFCFSALNDNNYLYCFLITFSLAYVFNLVKGKLVQRNAKQASIRAEFNRDHERSAG